MNFKIVLIILAVILFTFFLLQNTETVTVTFLFFDTTLPRSILLFITLALGMFIGILIPVEFRKSRKRKSI